MINKIHNEDCLATMARMDDNSIDCCITSPPYWGLRDYQVDGQLGLESTPEKYSSKMVLIFSEVKRVLKKKGTLWINLGDSYNGSGGAGGDYSEGGLKAGQPRYGKKLTNSLKPKDLCGIPWRVAFALQADGWYLRSDIIWAKPNPMPESVTDRPTKAHEYIFLMSKNAKYYYDADAIREEHSQASQERMRYPVLAKGGKCESAQGDKFIASQLSSQTRADGTPKMQYNPSGRNKRTVWHVATQPYKEAHFATYPEKLIEPCVLAGCPKDGVIYDPFMGAGTTALVALRAERNFIGSEINSEYVKIAENRLKLLLQQYKLFI